MLPRIPRRKKSSRCVIAKISINQSINRNMYSFDVRPSLLSWLLFSLSRRQSSTLVQMGRNLSHFSAINRILLYFRNILHNKIDWDCIYCMNIIEHITGLFKMDLQNIICFTSFFSSIKLKMLIIYIFFIITSEV